MENNDDLRTESSLYKKGINLEKAFCRYLKDEMKFEKTRMRAQMKSNLNNRGSNVDIVAAREDIRGKRLKIIGTAYLTLFALLFIYGIYQNDNDIMLLSFVIEVVGGIAFVLSKRFTVEHAWVECKNQKTKVSFAQMQKTIHEWDSYKASKDKEYKFVEQYFVSTSGFVETALKLAYDKNIVCFVYENNSFKKIDYWERE